MIQYANYAVTIINPDNSTSTAYETFQWDLVNSPYTSVWGTEMPMASMTVNSVDADIAAAIASDSGDGVISGSAIDSVVNDESTAFTSSSQFFADTLNLAQADLNGAYTDSSSTVKIDSSVTNVATAKARVGVLLTDLKGLTDRTKVILDDIKGSGTIVGVAKACWYASEVQTNHQLAKNYAKELNLIKVAYPAAFK